MKSMSNIDGLKWDGLSERTYICYEKLCLISVAEFHRYFSL